MAIELIEIDAAWAEKWMKTRVPFLSAPTVIFIKKHLWNQNLVLATTETRVLVLDLLYKCWYSMRLNFRANSFPRCFQQIP